MEIKEPAAIFSEVGLKMFIEAIQESERAKQQLSNSDSEVDKLIKEYKTYKEKETEPTQLDNITDYLSEFFADGEIKNTEAIMNYLNHVGDKHYTLRSIASTMRAVMNRNPGIKKLSAKHYQLIIEDKAEEVVEDAE